MAQKKHLTGWILEAVARHSGEATIVEVCKDVWNHHESELRDSGSLFYTWGYDIRWARQWLRDNGYLLPPEECKKGFWVATGKGIEAAKTGIP